jgi:hypothetical protein
MISLGEQISAGQRRIWRKFIGELLHKAEFRTDAAVNKNFEKRIKGTNSLI